MATKAMTTAKDLARKAYVDAVQKEREGWHKNFSPEERFESWWSEYYSREEHKDGFYHKHSVFIDLKRFIQAE
jgi:hypothetical protein